MIDALALPTMEPVPRARIRITEIPAGATYLTLWRRSRSGDAEVREAVMALATNPFTAVDYSVPWNEDVVYYVDFFSSVGAPLGPGVRQYGDVRVTFFGTVLHQPMNPSLRVGVTDLEATAQTIVRRRLGDSVRAGSGMPLWIGQGGLDVATQLRMGLLTDSDRAAAEAMFGTRAAPLPPILCLRTSKPLQLPQPFIFLVPETSWQSFDHSAGKQTTVLEWDVVEAEEPAIGLLASPFTYEDVEAYYDTYEDLEADNDTYEELEERSSLQDVVQ